VIILISGYDIERHPLEPFFHLFHWQVQPAHGLQRPPIE
jgi:hypothetical protein